MYQLKSVLGVGGLATVYLASRFSDGKVVALKLANNEKGEGPPAMLRHEAKLLSRLEHPNIVSVVECGDTSDGEPFLAVDVIRGQTLDQLMIANGGTLSLLRAGNICLQIAGALAHAHVNGIVHRDIKPSNVLIAKVDGHDFVILFDFGIACDTTAAEDMGSDSGSLLYIAPEQLLDGQCTASSDVYQLALVFLELVTGQLPYAATYEDAVSYKRGEVPLLLSDDEMGSHRLDPQIRRILERSLTPNPEKRISSMSLFGHELGQAMLKQRIMKLRDKVENADSGGLSPFPIALLEV
jgi:serine/threonine-protein kinase